MVVLAPASVQVEGAFLLDVVVGEILPIFKLPPTKVQSLLEVWDSFLVLE